jgi:glycosyltransferase involved in cell wall biosynthesis
MKICIEAQRLFRNHKHGMEIVALETIRALQEMDHENEYHIIAAEDEDQSSLVTDRNFIVHRLPPAPYPIWEQIHLPRYVKKLKPDVLHCTANTGPLMYGGKMIVTIHDLIFMDKTDTKGSNYQRFGNYYRKIIAPKIARKACDISTVSAFSANEIQARLHIPSNKIRVIHNGVSDLFRPITDTALQQTVSNQYALPEQFILHIGNTAPRKNTLNVVKAFAAYQQHQSNALPLVILGCSESFIAETIAQHQIQVPQEKIVMPGYVSTMHLPVIYSMSRVFLYPSFSEGFGLPVLEAMACGVPVITSDNSSLKEVAGNAALLVQPESVTDIENAIVKATGDDALRKFMQTQGIMNALRFSWTSAAEKTLQLYKACMDF